MSYFKMSYEDKNIRWFVLFAANVKAAKVSDYLKTTDIEYFYPMFYPRKSDKKQ